MGLTTRRTPPPWLGELIRTARMRAGLRGREGARLAGISPGFLCDLEVGRSCPSTSVARALAEAFKMTEAEREPLLAAAVSDAGRDHPLRRSA
jgi:transcriptional regulator with XRE-family HTH domain